jgi:hypothetical protein
VNRWVCIQLGARGPAGMISAPLADALFDADLLDTVATPGRIDAAGVRAADGSVVDALATCPEA